MDRVNELTKDSFNAILELRAMDERAAVSPPVVHRRFVALFDALKTDAQSLDVQERDALDMMYALVALADEVALTKSEPIRAYWVGKPLQMHYFDENLAGEGFFRRLAALRGNTQKMDTLRVYYLCLLFGFQGSYVVQGDGTELVRLQESLRSEIARAMDFPEILAPSAAAVDDLTVRGRRSRLHVWIGLGALAVSFAIYIGLRLVLDGHVHDLVAGTSSTAGTSR
jgi:type VI secretion system protein ImpK